MDRITILSTLWGHFLEIIAHCELEVEKGGQREVVLLTDQIFCSTDRVTVDYWLWYRLHLDSGLVLSARKI